MGRFSLDVETDSVGGFRLDLKIGFDSSVGAMSMLELEGRTSCSVIEVPTYELRNAGELNKRLLREDILTSLDALAMSENAGGGNDMAMNGWSSIILRAAKRVQWTKPIFERQMGESIARDADREKLRKVGNKLNRNRYHYCGNGTLEYGG